MYSISLYLRLAAFSILFVCLSFSLSCTGYGQSLIVSPTGAPIGAIPGLQYSGTSIDHVNMFNYNVSFSIPLITMKGRGLDTNLTLFGNMVPWQQVDNGQYSILAGGGAAFGASFARMGGFGITEIGCDGASNDGTCDVPAWDVRYVGDDGTSIQLGYNGSATGGINTLGVPDYALYGPLSSADGSYAVADLSKIGQLGALRFPDGISINGKTVSDGGKISDRNGNLIACQPQIQQIWDFTCTDTIGRRIRFSSSTNSTVYGSASTVGPYDSITYTDSNGVSQTIKYTWSAVEHNLLGYNLYHNDFGPDPTDPNPAESGWDLTAITLPNGQSYQLQYGSNSDGSSTGMIEKLTLPSGGYIRYTYGILYEPPTNGNNATFRMILSDRYVSSDGTSGTEAHYHYGSSYKNNVLSQTITFPDGSTQTVDYMSQSSGIPSRIALRGSDGTLLRSVDNTITTDSTTAPLTGPFHLSSDGNPRVTVSTTTLDDGSNLVTNTQFDTFSNPTHVTVVGSDGTNQTIDTAYLADQNAVYAAPAVNLLRLPVSVSMTGSGGNASSVSYGYDACCLADAINAVGHDDVDYPATLTTRGNLTRQTQSNGTSTIDTIFTYDYLGNRTTDTDPNGHTTTHAFADSWKESTCAPGGAGSAVSSGITYAYETTTTNALSQPVQQSYYSCSGLVASKTDPNDIAASRPGTTYTYDLAGSLVGIIYPDGGSTTTNYNSYANPLTIQTTQIAAPDPSIVSSVQYDGLGRPSQITNADGSHTETSYDNMGRVASVTNSHLATPSSTDGINSFSYDSLGRLLYHCNPDNGTTASCSPGSSYQQWLYSGNQTTFYDELRHSWQRTTDSLGRLTNVVEPGGTATSYQYDVLGNLKMVNQTGTSSETPRLRFFYYDSLSHLITASNPETGTICYGIWSGSDCINGYDANGNLLHKTDARRVAVNYSYDSINHLVSKTYPVGSHTPSSCYSYDESTSPGGGTITNPIGRLTTEWTQAGACASTRPASFITSRAILAYDPMGRVTKEQQCTPANCTVGTKYALNYSYDLAGNVTKGENGIGSITWLPAYDSAGRLSTVTGMTVGGSQYPTQLFNATEYGPFGVTKWLMGGSSVNDPALTFTKTYDNRMRVTGEIVKGIIGQGGSTPGTAAILITGGVQSK